MNRKNNPNSPKIADMYSTQAVYQEARKAYQRAIADPEVQELLRIRDKAEMDYADAMARAVDKATKKAEKEKKELAEKAQKAEEEKKQLVDKLDQAEKEKKEQTIESAKTALAMGLTVDQVSKITGLSLDEVKKL